MGGACVQDAAWTTRVVKTRGGALGGAVEAARGGAWGRSLWEGLERTWEQDFRRELVSWDVGGAVGAREPRPCPSPTLPLAPGWGP